MEHETNQPESEWPPSPPEGYDLHESIHVQPWYVTVFLAIWGVGAFVGVPLLVVLIKGLDITLAVYKEVLLPGGFAEAGIYGLWIIGSLVAMLSAHEGLHAFVARMLGYKTKFSIEKYPIGGWTPQVLTYGRFESRFESAAITLAPLIIITPVSIATLVMADSSWAIATAAYITLGNVAGSVADLGAVWLLAQLPSGTLLYHDSTGRKQCYVPASGM